MFPFEWYAWKTYFDNFTFDMTSSLTSFFLLLIEISGKILIFSVWLLCDYWSASNPLSNDIQIIRMSKDFNFSSPGGKIPPFGPFRARHSLCLDGLSKYSIWEGISQNLVLLSQKCTILPKIVFSHLTNMYI